MDQLVNSTIKDYQISEFLATGGMGAVYRATQQSVGRDVIVKVIRQEFAQDETFLRNFRFEAQTIARLESAFIVPLIDYWSDNTGTYMVMRYMRGGSLRDALEAEGPWPIPKISALLDQISRALNVAHLKGIIHRDIKPANILLDEQGIAYLGDFGLASEQQRAAGERGYTPAYASPEQIQEKRDTAHSVQVSFPSDIYSLGVVLFEMLTGARPFTDPTISDLEARHLEDPLPPVTTLRSGLNQSVNEVIWKATAKDPLDRYPTAIELYNAFQVAIGAGAGVGTTDSGRVAPGATLINPYKGLQPFEQYDTGNFFGRDDLINRLLNRIRETRFLAVVGPSGSGKSSVVKAGVIPRLREGVITNADRWYIEEMTPGRSAIGNLAETLKAVLKDPPPSLEEQLRMNPDALGTLVQEQLRGDASAQLLLVIDQFEEVFTLNSPEEAQRFTDAIARAVQATNSRLRVIITLRADFYDRPLQIQGFGQLVSANTETVTPLDRTELEAAIVGPVQRLGVGLEANLANVIIDDVGGQPGVLPLLQHALRELFDDVNANEGMLTLRSYRRIGGVTGALGRRAQETYEQLSPDQQALARDLFLSMLTVNADMEATRRRVLRTDLPNDTRLDDVIDAFGEARLLTFDRDPETRVPTIDIAHEALIRSWPQLREWADENRDALRTYQQLRNDTQDWVEQGLDSQFLAPEGRLAQYEDLQKAVIMPISGDEKRFIEESARKRDELIAELRRIAEVERQNAEEQRRNAEQQARSARRFGIVAAVAGILFLVAIGLVFLVNGARGVAQANERIAQTRAVEAQIAQENAVIAADNLATQVTAVAAARDEAATQAVIAQQNEATATFAVGGVAAARDELGTQVVRAEEAGNEAATQAAIAQQNEATATVAQGQAEQAAADLAAQVIIAEDARNEAATQAAIAQQNEATATIAQGQAEQAAADLAAQVIIAEDARNEAATQAAIAVANANEAAIQATNAFNNQNLAQTQAAIATIAQGEAEANAVALATQIIERDRERLRAEAQATNAFISQLTAEAARVVAAQEATVAAIARDEAANQAAIAVANANEAATQAAIAQQNEIAVLSRSMAAQAELLLDAGEYQLAVALAMEANRIPDAPPDVQRVLSLASYQGPRDIRLGNRFNPVNTITACGIGENRYLTGANDGEIILWRITNGQLRILDSSSFHESGISALACNAEGSRAASGDAAGNIVTWQVFRDEISRISVLTISDEEETDTGEPINPDATPAPDATPTLSPTPDDSPSERVLALAYDPRSAYLVAGYEAVDADFNAVFRLWDLETDEVVENILGHSDAVSSVIIKQDGTQMVSASLDGEIILWDVENLFNDDNEYDVQRRVQTGTPIYSLDLNAAQDRIVAAGSDGSISVWDTEELQQQERMTGGHTLAVRRAVYGQDADEVEFIVSASDDRTLALWDAETFQLLRRYSAHEQPVTGVAFGPDAALISTSADQDVMLWDLKSGAEQARGSVPDVFEQSDIETAGGYAATFADNRVYLWGTSLRGFVEYQGVGEDVHEAVVSSLAIHPDGDYVLSGDIEGFVILGSTERGTREGVRQWEAHPGASVQAVAFSPDGELAVTGASDRSLRLWAVERGQEIPLIATPAAEDAAPGMADELFGHRGGVMAAAFCCDDPAEPALARRMASGSDVGEIILWVQQPDSTWTLTQLDGHSEGQVTGLAFTPDGTLLISSSSDNTLIAWDADPESETYLQALATFRQHTAPVNSVDVSPDGTLAISASNDGTVIVWDVRENVEDPVSGAPVAVLLGHTDAVNQARFISNASALSSGSDGQVIRWRVDKRDDLISWAEDNRFVPPLDNDNFDESIRGQTGCSIRAEYNFQRQCVEGVLPTASPTVVPSPTPTLDQTLTATPTLTPSITPTPTATLVPAAEQESAAIMSTVLPQNANYYEAERRDLEVIDQSSDRNTLSWRSLDGVYGDFVFHTRIDWGAGSLQDRCGFLVRYQDRDNYYILQLDQLGNVTFTEKRDGEFLNENEGFIDVDPQNIRALPVENNTREGARLIVIGRGEQMQVYVNDSLSPVEFAGVQRSEGYLALAATVLDRSRETGCIFTDTWVTDLDRSAPPPPTPVPTALPALSYTVEDVPNTQDIIAELTAHVPDFPVEGGFLSQQASRLIVDISDLDEAISWEYLDADGPTYTNFAMGGILSLDSDSESDKCGFIFRLFNSGNFYTIQYDRRGNLLFREQENNEWEDDRELDGSAVRIESGAQNELVVVGIDISREGALPESRFVVYVNGQYAGEIRDGTNTEGFSGVSVSTVDTESTLTRCTFERAWIWNLDEEDPPQPEPQPDPVQQPEPLQLGIPQAGDLPLGGRDIWRYFSPGDERVNVSVTAQRPASGTFSFAPRLTRRLLDVELRITYCETGEFVAFGGDIQAGRDTNVRVTGIELTAPGDYCFEVYSFEDADQGPYTLLIEPVTEVE